MMRTQNLAICALGALAAAALAIATPQTPGAPLQQEQGPKLVVLEKRIETLEKQLETLSAFTEAQAAAGEELMDALARSEAEGFTAGINPKSREILLAGLRAQAKAMQAAESEDDKGKSSRRVRGDRARRSQEGR